MLTKHEGSARCGKRNNSPPPGRIMPDGLPVVNALCRPFSFALGQSGYLTAFRKSAIVTLTRLHWV